MQGFATTGCALPGQRLPSMSCWAGTLGFDYELPVSESGSLIFHAGCSSRSGYYGYPSLSRYTWIKGYNVANAVVGYRAHGWEVDVFTRNLFGSD